MEEHAVIVHFDYSADSLHPLHQLEDALEEAVTDADVGDVDGHEIAADLSNGSLYMYGADADALFAVAHPLLAAAECFSDARVTLRYGPPKEGVKVRVVVLDAEAGDAADGEVE